MIRILASYNDKVAQFVLENAHKSAKYTSPTIQKEILHVIASKVRSKIREDIGDSKFCIIVDESRDESKREQLALVLRFVDNGGFIQEHFIDLSHVKDTTALTLKNEIYAILSRHYLGIQNIHGQGYDGASNMCGEWKGLQALVLNDCPYAYFVHYFAHRLQLALVAATREVIPIHEFFLNLNFIITTVGSLCKRNDELRVAQATKIDRMLAIDELETGTGANQIGTLKWAGDCWGPHFNSICSLVRMFGPTCLVLENIKKDGSTYLQCGDANIAHKMINSFEFIFSLHLMMEIMDVQLQELDNRFGEQPTELLTLCSALDPKDAYKSFNVDDICRLVEKYYPLDFFERDRTGLKIQLKLFEHDVQNHLKFQNLSSMVELCRRLIETENSQVYPLIDQLICLVLTFLVSITTGERAFFAMKIVKTRLRNKMEDEFLSDNLVVYIEKEITENFTTNSILDDFRSFKERRLQF
ncbi:uncharacterized protein LOC126703853 [Quercus robur]|uniref:uncharacterized protein LOC126703853 n=1 Tax=Quercus robur TaxID=38942 RepID=UPI0021621358|nr:uncharacterized protein LOC126703853 [Quercus robur]